jgi:CRISPR-associated endonuclease/helicase Cas3
MIESGLMPLTINDTEAVQNILDSLNNEKASPGKAARDLQPYVVQVPPKDVATLRGMGRVAFHRPDLWGDQFEVLTAPSLYTREMGLIWENADALEETIF